MNSICVNYLHTAARNKEGKENKNNSYLKKCVLMYLLYHNDSSSTQN